MFFGEERWLSSRSLRPPPARVKPLAGPEDDCSGLSATCEPTLEGADDWGHSSSAPISSSRLSRKL